MGVSKAAMQDAELINAVRAMTKLGYTQEYIAEVLHTSAVTIGNICVYYGIKRTKKAIDPEKERREHIRKVMEKAYKEGCTDKEIASKAQISVGKVKYWRIRNNLDENRSYAPCPAKNCKYHATDYGQACDFEHGCDYAIITRRTRTAQLTKKEMRTFPCPLFEEGKRERAKPEPIVLKGSKPKNSQVKYDWDYAEKLWRQGNTDAEIAEIMGCSLSMANYHRRMWGPANVKKSAYKTKYDRDLGRDLFLIGRTNREIADELGAPIKTVQRWTHAWREEDG